MPSSTAEAPGKPGFQERDVERPSSHKWLITIAIMLGATLEVLDTSIVNVSLPHMQGAFSASVDEITWVVTSYIVANGIMIPLTGWISSRLGRKRYFLISVGVFVAASGLCGAATSLRQMVIFRLIQGGAGAAMIPSSQAILMETFPPQEQQLAMSMWGLGMLTSPMLGPTLGGWITYNWNWRWNFYINLPIGIMALIMVYIFVQDPDYMRKARTTARRVDYFGIACLVVGLGLFQIVLDRGQRADWFATTWVRIFTVVAASALILLVIRELRFPEPILDLSILKIPQFDISVVILMSMSLITWGMNLINPLFFQELLNYSPWKSGLAVVPRGFGTLFAMLLIGQLARRGVNTMPLVGFGFFLLAFALWQMSQWTLSVSMRNEFFPMVVSGLATGLIFPTMSAATLSRVERERMGYAASLYNMMRNMGAAVGISMVTNLLNSQQQIHQSYLTQHFTIFDAWKIDNAGSHMPGFARLNLMHGLMTHQAQGLGMVYGAIQQQASLLAYNDIYRLLAMMSAVFIPTFLLVRKHQTSSGAATH